MTINSVLANLRHWNRKFFAAARPALSDQERFILSAASAALPDADRSVLAKQLAALDLIQRSPGGRVVAFFLESHSKLPLLSCSEPEHCLVQLKVVAANKSISVVLMSHRGRVSSIEYRGAPERFSHGELSVVEANPYGSYAGAARVLDRFEHGSGGHA